MKKDSLLLGLTSQQVEQAQTRHQINRIEKATDNGLWPIIKKNIFTIYNGLNFIIALALISVQAWSNLFFFVVICFNALTGIFAEWRAKRLVNKLNLLNQEKVTVIRDGLESKIASTELVLGDLILLSAGQQVPSDGIVHQGFAEVNEAMLTGESDLVIKHVGETVLSSSYLVSGQIYVTLTHVGAKNYAAKIVSEAKCYQPMTSQILSSFNQMITHLSKAIIPIGILLFLESWFLKSAHLKDIVIHTATPLIGMMPQGIALLTISALLTAMIKLGRHQVLVQNMYAVETLARVNTLCLDKTGTITQGKMSVEQLIAMDTHYTKDELKQLLATYTSYTSDHNPTTKAIVQAYGQLSSLPNASVAISFSSERKWGAVNIADFGNLLLGAPEILLGYMPQEAHQAQEEGGRILALVKSDKDLNSEKPEVPKDVQLLALLVISDPIRDGAEKTLDYLARQNIDLKIISGDNPLTVSNIARKAGLDNYQDYLDCYHLDDSELVKSATTTAIFGRVSPHQKKLLVKTLKQAGRTVAMTGDGVNDILALREADCSIAMAEGEPATRQVANLVLLNSNFNDLPEILFEGRRVINNIARITPIFFIKTIFSFLLALITLLSSLFLGHNFWIYPFTPVQITLIDQFIEGFPPFILSFERNIRPIDQHFLKKSFFMALPSGIMIALAIIFINSFGHQFGWSPLDQTTVAYYFLGIVGAFSVIRVCVPINLVRLLLIAYSLIGSVMIAYFMSDMIGIGRLNHQTFPILITMLILALLLFVVIDYKQKAAWKTKTPKH